VKSIADIKITKVFEVSGLAQQEHKFDRVLSECANNTLIVGGPNKTCIVTIPLPPTAGPMPGQEHNAQIQQSSLVGQVLFSLDKTSRFAHIFH